MISMDLALAMAIMAMGLSYCMGYAKGVLSCKDPSRISKDSE
jgi:hypothetical protein